MYASSFSHFYLIRLLHYELFFCLSSAKGQRKKTRNSQVQKSMASSTLTIHLLLFNFTFNLKWAHFHNLSVSTRRGSLIHWFSIWSDTGHSVLPRSPLEMLKHAWWIEQISVVIWTKAKHWKLLRMNLIVKTLENVESEQFPVYPTSYTLKGCTFECNSQPKATSSW